MRKERTFPGTFNPFTQVEIQGYSPVLEVAEVTILPLGLLGVFLAVWKKGKFPHFFEVGGETIFGHQDFQHLWVPSTC